MYLEYYLKKLNYYNRPLFLDKYLNSNSLLRLKKISYFCGMDYASKDIYNFLEYISRYDHSLSTSLLTYKLTKDKKTTLAGLFHDISTPCFSHVIDYMIGDYEKQEITEEYTDYILKNDEYLNKCLDLDGICIDDIINFKNYSVVDNNRPKLCADRLDGIILTGISWTKNINNEDISNIVSDMCLYDNEDGQLEIGFKTYSIAKKVVDVNDSIDIYCHAKEDIYMMELLAEITRLAISKKYISYYDLYHYTESDLFNLFKSKNDKNLNILLEEFKNIKKIDIPDVNLPKLKVRKLRPLVNGNR